MYVTAAQLAERPGPRELMQVASSEAQPVNDEALMDATLRGADRSGWDEEEIAAADAALARVQDAIAESVAVIDGYLAKRYTLPLQLSPSSTSRGLLLNWARSITRYLLNKDRFSEEGKDPVVRDYKDALKMLKQVAEGVISLGVDDPAIAAGKAAGSDVRFNSVPAAFGRDQLHYFR